MRLGYLLIVTGIVLLVLGIISSVSSGTLHMIVRALFASVILIGYGIRRVNKAKAVEDRKKRDEVIKEIKVLMEKEGDECVVTKGEVV